MGTKNKNTLLPEWPSNPVTVSGSLIYLGYSVEVEASPSGKFYSLKVGTSDYEKEIAIRVTGSGTATISCTDEAFLFLKNDGTTSTTLVLSPTNIPNVEYRVLGTNVVRPMRGYVISTGGGGGGGGGSTGPEGPWAMLIGSQSWFHAQQQSADEGDDSLTWTGDYAMVTVPPINWASVDATSASPGDLMPTNVWRAETLALWSAIKGPIRFMDWACTNYNPMVDWADRVLPTDSNYEQYGAPDSSGDPPSVTNKGMAPELMIDLCNRVQKDMWICIPHQFTDAAISSLAALIHDRLDPALKVYIEYSNETWNFGSGTIELDMEGNSYTGGNHRAQLDHIIMEGIDNAYPGGNPYYVGYSYHCARSYQCWYLFSGVFEGEESRLVNTICCNGNIDLLRQGLLSTYTSPTYNPHDMVVNLICTAPYIEGQTSTDWQTSVNDALYTFGNANEVKGLALTYSCDWGCYEGGVQAAGSGVDTWSTNPDIYNAYLYLYNKMAEAGCSVFCHYTMVGKRSSTQAWGLLDNTFEDVEDAHRWRATLAWITDNP